MLEIGSSTVKFAHFLNIDDPLLSHQGMIVLQLNILSVSDFYTLYVEIAMIND